MTNLIKKCFNVKDVLEQTVSLQLNTWSDVKRNIKISEVLNAIKTREYESKISELRKILESGNTEDYVLHKKTLPAITFCGTFDEKRKLENLLSYNSILVVDIDKLDKIELDRVKTCLLSEKRVFSFWESPSKKGIKALVYIDYVLQSEIANLSILHKMAFDTISSYFKLNHSIEIDRSGSDLARLCFFSSDENLVLKLDLEPFIIYSEASSSDNLMKERKAEKIPKQGGKNVLFNPVNRNDPNNRKLIQTIIKFLVKRNLSITYDYADWYKVGLAIANTFTYDLGEKYFLQLSALDSTKYEENNCKIFLVDCYQSGRILVTFGTIIFLAKNKGYTMKNMGDRGSEAVFLSQVSSS